MVQRRSGMKLIYVGDIGTITLPAEAKPFPTNIDIDSLSTREMMNLAIEHGVPVKDLIGIDNCYEHVDMTALGDRPLPGRYSLLEDCKYCKNCFQTFRPKKK